MTLLHKCLCVSLYLCVRFDYFRKSYMNLQGTQGREDEQTLANHNQDKGSHSKHKAVCCSETAE